MICDWSFFRGGGGGEGRGESVSGGAGDVRIDYKAVNG